MGMTDKQFDAYTKGLLRQLEMVEKELKEKSVNSPTLTQMIKDLDEQLRRP